ncbi:MAG: UDP-N-acetylmuramoyl-tripeptide--D-alanyl-D-alanine ligase [Elusimicrobia bacterium]|nr:UDP-N-acetylmuramoyl-tripeptide--D-alanyl-D-alanine ligase [Elusimicrobiota bacterium]
MENLFLNELIKAVNGEFLIGNPRETVEHISIDTRTLQKGDYYFAIKGNRFDGHKFVKNAVEKGAKGIIISEKEVDFGNPFPTVPSVIRVEDTTKALGDLALYYRKKWNIPLVAITGSNGKTTAKQMLFSILSKKGKTLCNQGNFNNQIGLPLTLFELSKEHQFAIVEMGTSLPGEIARLSEIAMPAIGVITNIGYTHLENFKDKEGVFEEKKTLFNNLKTDGCAVINIDDEYLKRLISNDKYAKITFSINSESDIKADNIDLRNKGVSFDLHISSKTIRVHLPVYGIFNVYNAMAASCAAFKLGIDIDLIRDGLQSYSQPKMRMEIIELKIGATVVNDAYNSNPSSVRESITSMIQAFPNKEKLVVLGDMLELGQDSEKFHSELGDFIDSQFLNKIYLYGPQMKNTFTSIRNSSALYFKTKEELLAELQKYLNKDSVVLFKASRGMALEEVINKLI